MTTKQLRCFAVLLTSTLSSWSVADPVDVLIKGVDDGVKTTKHQDYREAVMNAKLQAIERAGVEIESINKVVHFQTKFDMAETKAKAILMPGSQIVDLGYQVDGTYAIVLSGRVATGNSQAQGLPSGGSTARDVAGVYVISKEGSQPMFKVSLKAIGKKDLAATFVGNEPGWDFDKPQFDLAKLDDGVIHIHWTTMDRDGGSDDFNITFDSESGQGMYHHTIRDVSLGHAVVRHSAFEVTAKRR